jgi:hypothetical protein
MKIVARLLFAASLIAAPTVSAHAAGCLKGALVGGVAGHFAHHPIVGAAVGCAIGHHRAALRQREQRQQDRDSQGKANRGSEGRF